MTYSLHFSAASRGVHHSVTHNDIPKGDAIEMDTFKIMVLDKMAAGKFMLAGSSVPKMIPSVTAAPTFAALALMQVKAKLHILENAINALLLKAPGKININARHEHLLWPTTGENFSLVLHSGRTPREVMREIYKFLEKEDFNQWGPLVRICHEITAFFALAPGKDWTINVTLTD